VGQTTIDLHIYSRFRTLIDANMQTYCILTIALYYADCRIIGYGANDDTEIFSSVICCIALK